MVSKIKSKLKIVHIKHEKKKKRISYMNITFFKVPNIRVPSLYNIKTHINYCDAKKGVQKQWEFKETNLYQKVDACKKESKSKYQSHENHAPLLISSDQ